jgi:hypothetical protein
MNSGSASAPTAAQEKLSYPYPSVVDGVYVAERALARNATGEVGRSGHSGVNIRSGNGMDQMDKYVRVSAHTQLLVPFMLRNNFNSLVIPPSPLISISRFIHHVGR